MALLPCSALGHRVRGSAQTQGGGETAPTPPWAKRGESVTVSNGPDPVSPAHPRPWQPWGTSPNTDLTVTLLPGKLSSFFIIQVNKFKRFMWW